MAIIRIEAEAKVDDLKAKSKIRTVHIDTSVQIERCKAYRKAQIVNKSLQHFPFKSTSSYAKYEFKAAWLRDLTYLYSASQKVSQVEELYGYIDDKLNANLKTRNRLSRCLQAMESFLSKIEWDISPRTYFVRLQSHIRNTILGAYTWWNQSITHEYGGTGCVRAFEEPRELLGGKIDCSIPQCRPNNINCAIHEFFKKNEELFTSIAIAIESLSDNASKELKEAKKIIEDAKKNPNYLCDDRVCRKLGDVLIAIDGVDMDCFAANNDKEWGLLSKVLGKELINPVRDAKTLS
jgi:hypothetical protein